MSQYDVDLFVIGGGSGGVRAARIASSHGATVAIAEEYRYGGTCVIRGCVPKKLFVYASDYARAFEDAKGYGWTVPEPTFDWNALVAAKDKEIDRLNHIYIKLLKRHGVAIHHERAVIEDPHTLRVGDKQITAKYILIAVGAAPYFPDVPGIEHAISSNDAFHLSRLPANITVVGGGYIALEFAGIFAGLGRHVDLVYRRDKLLRGFDECVRERVTRNFDGQVHLHLETEITAIESSHVNPDGFALRTKSGTSTGTIEAGAVMYATGRVPYTQKLGLEAAGIETDDNGAIAVDTFSQTTCESVYAVGDCTDRLNLTPVAIREGHAFADSVFGGTPRSVDHDDVATAVFCQPSVGAVGLAEAEAHRRGIAVDIYRSEFRPMRFTLAGRDEKVFMKLVVERKSERVIGVHMIGGEAAEIIQCMAIAVKMGATKSQLDATVAVHPTTAEEFVLMRDKYIPPAEPM